MALLNASSERVGDESTLRIEVAGAFPLRVGLGDVSRPWFDTPLGPAAPERLVLALFLSISRDGREAPKLPWRALSAHQWKVGELWRLVTSTLGASRRVFLPKSLPLFGSLETY